MRLGTPICCELSGTIEQVQELHYWLDVAL